eukprot:scaffold381436_cov22-Prasinocladus_malaysianus.AAC.1
MLAEPICLLLLNAAALVVALLEHSYKYEYELEAVRPTTRPYGYEYLRAHRHCWACRYSHMSVKTRTPYMSVCTRTRTLPVVPCSYRSMLRTGNEYEHIPRYYGTKKLKYGRTGFCEN